MGRTGRPSGGACDRGPYAREGYGRAYREVYRDPTGRPTGGFTGNSREPYTGPYREPSLEVYRWADRRAYSEAYGGYTGVSSLGCHFGSGGLCACHCVIEKHTDIMHTDTCCIHSLFVFRLRRIMCMSLRDLQAHRIIPSELCSQGPLNGTRCGGR